MQNAPTISLRRMRNTDLAAINYAEDIRGKSVIDADGCTVGVVSRLFIDSDDRKIRLIEVQPTSFDGASDRGIVLPVDAIAGIRRGVVQVDRPRSELPDGPPPQALLEDEQNVRALYDHYGLQPFWTDGYSYPPYPYYIQTTAM